MIPTIYQRYFAGTVERIFNWVWEGGGLLKASAERSLGTPEKNVEI